MKNGSNTLLNFFFLFIICSLSYSQTTLISGQVVSWQGEAIANAKIFIKDTNFQTRTDTLGRFSITAHPKGVLFIQTPLKQTQRIEYDQKKAATTNLEISIEPIKQTWFSYTNPQDEYALFILDIVQAQPRIKNYTLDYYSKAKIQLASSREKFLGQKRKDLDASLDLFDNSNYVYLGELQSKVTVLNPNWIKEQVIAQKETGTSKNLYFQTALDAQFDFYQNKVSNQLKLISPLAPYASSYYNYKVIAITHNKQGDLCYTIEFTPKREREPLLSGELSISGSSYELTDLYAVGKGENIGLSDVTQIVITQKFNYHPQIKKYLKEEQQIYVKGKFIVFDFTGQFSSHYNNFEQDKTLTKRNFTSNLIHYNKDFNQKDPAYWTQNRIAPLKTEEETYYNQRSTIENLQTKAALDSVDKRTNNFTIFKLVKGYSNINSHKNKLYNYRGLLSTFAFNAVQGFNVTTGIDYTKTYKDQTDFRAGTILNYGVSENKTRFSGYLSRRFNQNNYSTLSLVGGTTILQFNSDAPIKTPINSFASAWFGKNYAKYYQKQFIRIDHSRYIFRGLKFNSYLEYARQSNLENHLRNAPFVPNLDFSSNNPLDPNDYTGKAFQDNSSFKLNLNLDLVFDQKTITYPTKTQYLPLSKYPIISVYFEKALNATTSDYNYSLLWFKTTFNNNIAHFGNLYIGLSAGGFLEHNDIAFTDYKHFNGNKTFVGSSPIYNNQFNLLPYYEYSTKSSFIEVHMEHDFRGYLSNKIPLINLTGYSFVVGFHLLQIPEKNTYKEFSIGLNNVGFGKFRPFRIDYFTAVSADFPKRNGIVLGIKVLDLIQK